MLTALSKLPLATVLATLLLTTSSRTEGSSVTAIQNVQIVDVITGRVTPSAKILIVGGRISAAGRSVVVPSDARVIDAGGRFAIPGLWDMHVHSVHPSFLQKFVANGVTGIRDMGGARQTRLVGASL